ncbi:hypothetical protein SAMN06265365_1365 [Tistlia consotensis]|uniref:Uncharacterized protein n=1 Tax=Tistlia consotensis USBA 355 TaxID=560819 RepID=A0A1Y6CMN0_9PROT|nr:YeeE/YedE thiosulfate transporter family protein [Tistlia consotensis]SMF78096.1 hypothetical protein SAMN05428998_1386 [Tistlia consotensis USBA 355]SNS17773.1 hypothetical protein SAMN06265365_1365 [Tistlia consotensis]
MSDASRSFRPAPFWHPLVAGVALGLTLLLTFLVTGHGLGASGFFTRLAAAVSAWLAPGWTAANAYFGGFVAGGADPLPSWITWEAVGVVIGGLGGSLAARRFRPMVEAGPQGRGGGHGSGYGGASLGGRLAAAFAGGALVGFGGRLSLGCTSGLGLSGGATLAVAGFVFLIGFFLAGFAVSLILRKVRS